MGTQTIERVETAAVGAPVSVPTNWERGEVSESSALLLAIQRASADPSIDIDKMLRLYDLYKDMQARQAQVAFDAAYSAMQPHLPIIDEHGAITNNSGAVQSTYAEWEDINEAIRPILSAHGFGLSFRSGRASDEAKTPTLTAILSHAAGHREETSFSLPPDPSGSKNAVQAIGSSLSYMKRYTTILLLNLASRKREDDDGQAAGGSGPSAAAQAAISTINMCPDTAALTAWHGKNMQFVEGLSAAEQQIIVRTFNAKKRALKAEAEPHG